MSETVAIHMTPKEIGTRKRLLSAVCLGHFSDHRRLFKALLFASLCSSAAAATELNEENCKPILPVIPSIAKLPCAGTIKAMNVIGHLTSEEALVQARSLLWRHYTSGSSCFFNVELVSKEGLRTRIVYSVSTGDKEWLVVNWVESFEAQPGPNQKAKWSPPKEVVGAGVSRDESTGRLIFRKDGVQVGEL